MNGDNGNFINSTNSTIAATKSKAYSSALKNLGQWCKEKNLDIQSINCADLTSCFCKKVIKKINRLSINLAYVAIVIQGGFFKSIVDKIWRYILPSKNIKKSNATSKVKFDASTN